MNQIEKYNDPFFEANATVEEKANYWNAIRLCWKHRGFRPRTKIGAFELTRTALPYLAVFCPEWANVDPTNVRISLKPRTAPFYKEIVAAQQYPIAFFQKLGDFGEYDDNPESWPDCYLKRIIL